MHKIFARLKTQLESLRARCTYAFENYEDILSVIIWGPIFLAIFGAIYWAFGQAHRFPFAAGYVISWMAAIALPILMVLRHRWRQERLLDRIRAEFALSVEWLAGGQTQKAQTGLLRIRELERRWQIGGSFFYRLAYSLAVVVSTIVACAFWLLFYIATQDGLYGLRRDASLLDSVEYIVERPPLLWTFAAICVIWGLSATKYLGDLRGRPWAEFYGDRLSAALRAGRGVNTAPWHDMPDLPANVTARELLGLPERYTNAELRRAWLRLVQELHPDRWAVAGDGVRQMKEAALKRVNAARDELKSAIT